MRKANHYRKRGSIDQTLPLTADRLDAEPEKRSAFWSHRFHFYCVNALFILQAYLGAQPFTHPLR